MKRFYTGVGSRETPARARENMISIACFLGSNGWTLRSGKAEGADESFQLGVQKQTYNRENLAEIYLPWPRFNNNVRGLSSEWDIDRWPIQCYHIAENIHPAWNNLSPGAKKLHARNVCQVLGRDLKTPSEFVLFWAKESRSGQIFGGTRTAVMLAKERKIPTINMANDNWEELLTPYILEQ